MGAESRTLQHILNLEQVADGCFRGVNLDIGSQNVFGGQVLGQALAAANRTVDCRLAHSLHAYFLLPGDLSAPINFEVDTVRNGRSFATRSVAALQKGRIIFSMFVSYQAPEIGLDHQIDMPDVPSPEELPSHEELVKAAHRPNSEAYKIWPWGNLPLELRQVEPVNPYVLDKRPPFQKFWFRLVHPIPADRALQQCMLAYASDFGILHAARLPHGISFRQRNVRVASIDHAMWFHRLFDMNQWLLYVAESPSASSARGFVRGDIFTREGLLVASVAQEGLMRVIQEE